MYRKFKIGILLCQLLLAGFSIVLALEGFNLLGSSILKYFGFLFLHLAGVYIAGEFIFWFIRFTNKPKDISKSKKIKLPTLHSIISSFEASDKTESEKGQIKSEQNYNLTKVDYLVFFFWLAALYPMILATKMLL